jgi:hypothetical protein
MTSTSWLAVLQYRVQLTVQSGPLAQVVELEGAAVDRCETQRCARIVEKINDSRIGDDPAAHKSLHFST